MPLQSDSTSDSVIGAEPVSAPITQADDFVPGAAPSDLLPPPDETVATVPDFSAWWPFRRPNRQVFHNGSLRKDAAACGVSMLLHMGLLLLLALVTLSIPRDNVLSLVASAPLQERVNVQQFHFSPEPQEQIGDRGLANAMASRPAAPELFDHSTDLRPETLREVGEVSVSKIDDLPRGPVLSETLLVHGEAGVGTTGALGAVDRITHEIMLSLEQRNTLVVWLFDQSGSLDRQRETILARFDRIYEELGLIEASGNPAFLRNGQPPLLTSVVAFGRGRAFMTPEPTDDLEEIRSAIAAIPRDDTGVENVFAAVHDVAMRFRKQRTGSSIRNVMLVVFTDEAGDDPQNVDEAIGLCGRYEMPVYVVGVPAPFGRSEAHVKYIDPDPRFDQSPQWVPVHQGPESLLPERIKLHLDGEREDRSPIASGFGPFHLTRLCYETGGIYFAVHPQHRLERAVRAGEVDELASHLKFFFDPEVMRRYRPDYISDKAYEDLLRENKARVALVQAARLSWVTPMESIRLEFPKPSEAELVTALSRAQQEAAKLEPKIGRIYAVLAEGEADRKRLTGPRWQAGYDLAMGRTLAVKVRTESYNAMLALAKGTMQFEEDRSDTWVLKPADTITVGSALEKHGQRAREYLDRVVREHADTPWAMLAKAELAQPLGWRWTERYAGLDRQREQQQAMNMRPQGRPDEQARMLPRPKPRRPLPAL